MYKKRKIYDKTTVEVNYVVEYGRNCELRRWADSAEEAMSFATMAGPNSKVFIVQEEVKKVTWRLT